MADPVHHPWFWATRRARRGSLFLAGRCWQEIEQGYRRRFHLALVLAGGLLLLFSATTPLSCLPRLLHAPRLGIPGPRMVRPLLTESRRRTGEAAELTRRRLASGALAWVDYVIAADRPGGEPRTAHVQIGELVAIQPVKIEIELDEDLTARPFAQAGAQDPDFAILEMVRPDYPDRSLAAAVEGLVTLRASVNTRGTVDRVEAVSNDADLLCEEVASAALLRWRFRPMEVAGNPVTFSVVVPFRFTIRSPGHIP
jgi:TonB family protein